MTIEYRFKHLNIDPLERETADAQVGDGRINFIFRARKRLGSIKCSDKTRLNGVFQCGTGSLTGPMFIPIMLRK
jgi:hypothetical protein